MWALAALLIVCCLVGCGSSTTPDQHLAEAGDKLAVTAAELALSTAVADATKNGSGDVFDKTQKVAAALKRARTDGVAPAWIDREIRSAESDVELVGCHDCFTILEDARS